MLSISLDPIQLINVVSDVDDDDVTVVTSNTTSSNSVSIPYPHTIALADAEHVDPKIDAINAMTIAPTHAIAEQVLRAYSSWTDPGWRIKD